MRRFSLRATILALALLLPVTAWAPPPGAVVVREGANIGPANIKYGLIIGALTAANAPFRVGTNGIIYMENGASLFDSGGTAGYANSGGSWTSFASGTGDFKADGSVPMTADLNMGAQALTNVGNVDGVDVSAHATSSSVHHSATVDTDTTYNAGTNMDLAGTTFSVIDNPTFASTVTFPSGIIEAGGNMGVGTASPDTLLTVDVVSTANVIKFIRDGGVATLQLNFPSSQPTWDANSDIRWEIGSVEKMRLDAFSSGLGIGYTANLGGGTGLAVNGNVGIMDASPDYAFDVSGDAAISGTATLAGAVVMSGEAGTAGWYVKLDGSGNVSLGDPSGGTVNSFVNWSYGGTSIVADSSTDTATFIAGTNISFAMSPTADSITITAAGGGNPLAGTNISVSGQTVSMVANLDGAYINESTMDAALLGGTIGSGQVSADFFLESEASAHASSASVHHSATVDTDTTYNAGTGISLAGTTFSYSGNFAGVSGSISNAQVPDNITVTAASISGTITSAQIAADMARDSELHAQVVSLPFASITGTAAVNQGGTGAGTLTDGGVLLGSGTGAVTPMAVLADSAMIVGDGVTDPVAESGATLRTSIGVAIGTDVQAYDATLADLAAAPLTEAESIGDAALPTAASFNAVTSTTIELGHATDTTLSRASAGDVNIEGNIIYRAGGTDVALADGGTGASTAALARAALEAPPPMDSVTIAGAALTLATYPIGKQGVAITLTAINCITDTGTVEIMLEEGTGIAFDGGVDIIASTITCDSNGAVAGTIQNQPIDAADWMAIRIGTEASSPTMVGVTWTYTVD